MATGIRGRMGASTSSPEPGNTQGARVGTRDVVLGDEVYLWVLVILEVLFIAYGRSALSRYHGG